MARRLLTAIAVYMLQQLPILSAEQTDSVNYYTGQIVTSTVYIQGKDTLYISDTQVLPLGVLYLNCPNGVLVTDGLDVEIGGSLLISGSKQNYIKFSYDKSGNRIRRENEVTNY